MTAAEPKLPLESLPVRVIEPWRPGPRARIAELWRSRALISHIGKLILLRRYRKTFLGWLWIPLRPALDVGSRALFFGGLLGVGSGDRPYLIFITFGMAGWTLFEGTVRWGTRSVRLSRAIARGLYFPRIPTLISSIVPALFDFLLYLAVAIVAVGYFLATQGKYYLAPVPQMAVAVLGLVLIGLFGLAVSFFTGAMATTTKEARFAVGYLMQFWFFVTPVVYPISSLPGSYRPIAEWNPITAPIEMVKFGLLSTAPPQTTSVVISLSVLTVLLFAGIWFFSRFERPAVARL